MILNGLFLVIITILYKANISYQWNPPSFISCWITIESPAIENPEILHGFNEVPAKVDVQIKVNNGMDYIFTGTGTSQRDNDDVNANPLGGIVYVYNDQKIVLYPPTDGIGVAYTGSTTHFNGPSSARGLYYIAQVRVRAWKASDFPDPLFTLSIPMNDGSGGPDGSFGEEPYTSADIPDLVVAQVELTDSRMISEGQGNIFLSDTTDNLWALSGVVFGYDSEKVKLWVPIQHSKARHYNGALFSYGDGFGYCETGGGISESSGTVRLKGYKLEKAFQTTFTHDTSSTSPNEIHFGSTYSLDTALVMVRHGVRENSNTPNNPGMVFNGAGSSMAGSMKYSGVVYVYNEDSALLYTPSSDNPNGYMVYLGERWGNGQHPSSEKSADVIVTVFSGDISTFSSTTYVDCTTTSTDGGVTTPIGSSTTTTKQITSFASTASQDKSTLTASTTHEMSTDATGMTTEGEMTTPIEASTSSTKITLAASTVIQGKSTATPTTPPDMTSAATGMTTGATENHISSTRPAGSRAIVFCPYNAVNLCDCEVVQNLSYVGHDETNYSAHLYKIDKKKTSAYIRKHRSAYDGRFSAKVIGLTGLTVLIIVVLSIACLDITRIKNFKKN